MRTTSLPRRSDERPTAGVIRERRIEIARRHPDWTEIRETELVRRGRYLVLAETDEILVAHRGAVFQTGSATLIAERFPIVWYLDRDGDLVYLERVRRCSRRRQHGAAGRASPG